MNPYKTPKKKVFYIMARYLHLGPIICLILLDCGFWIGATYIGAGASKTNGATGSTFGAGASTLGSTFVAGSTFGATGVVGCCASTFGYAAP